MVTTCIILTLAWRLEPGWCHWPGWRRPGLDEAGVDDGWSWSAPPQWHGQGSRILSCPGLEAVSLHQTSQWCREPWRDAQLWSAQHPSLSKLKRRQFFQIKPKIFQKMFFIKMSIPLSKNKFRFQMKMVELSNEHSASDANNEKKLTPANELLSFGSNLAQRRE